MKLNVQSYVIGRSYTTMSDCGCILGATKTRSGLLGVRSWEVCCSKWAELVGCVLTFAYWLFGPECVNSCYLFIVNWTLSRSLDRVGIKMLRVLIVEKAD